MPEPKNSPEAFHAEVLELLCYLMTAARGVIYEPRLYAPYRLAEGARRLIIVLENAGLAAPEWPELAYMIEHNMMRSITDEEACKQVIDEIVLRLARQLKEL